MTKKNKKESNEKLPVFTVEKIQNPLNDNERDNLTTLIAKSSELANLLQKLSKNKNNDYGMDIWSIINDKKDLNEEKGQEINKIIEELINNSDNKNDNQKEELLNQLFNFDDSNIFYLNYNLSQICNYLKKGDEKTQKDLVNKFINNIIWKNRIKNLSIITKAESENINNTSINELYEAKNYENNLLNIYKLILNNIEYNNEQFDFIIKNIFTIYYNTIKNCLNIDLEALNKQNKDDKETINKIKRIYKQIIVETNDLFLKNKFAMMTLIKLILNKNGNKEENMKDKFEFCYIDGIIKNNYQYLLEDILKLPLILTNTKFFKDDNNIKSMQKEFYIFICNVFFTQKNHDKIIQLLSSLYDNPNIFIILFTQKYEYNLKLYLKNLSEIFFNIYDIASNEFDFDNYIFGNVMPFIYDPFIKEIKRDSDFHDCLFGGYCLILANYIIKINNENFDKIINYKGKELKKYLFDEIIMYNCSKESISINQFKTSENSIKIKNSLKEASHLFISIMIKEYNSDDLKEQKNSFNKYMDKLDIFNKIIYKKRDDIKKNNGQESLWRLYYKEEDSSNAFIGLKNLGCTCYMNSLLQVFYHIVPFRESILQCECKEESKNSLYEVQKIFLFLKHLKRGYYTPDTFVNNYDNEQLNPHQQMDVDEFFSNILDKLENRLKNTGNDNLLKYFFQGRFNDTLTFQDGCDHHRTNVNDFYSIQLQVQNKKNIYESLDTLTEGELMNGDNCIFCPKCDKKFPALKRQCFRVLPRMLMFVLKRFEFNFDTMTKFKVNDYYEFPVEISSIIKTQNKIINIL